MSELIQRIEEIAKGKGLTFNRIEHDCGLGNGTIKRWSSQSPRLDKLVLVADYLEVSLDYIVYGTLRTDSSPKGERPDLEAEKERQGLTCDGLPLRADEVDLVAMYRLLSPSHQEEVFDLVYFKYKRHVEEKKDSIYSTYFDENENAESGPAGSREARDGTA
jgi:transcriptional regulator with XRE-family HTH domain